MSETSAGKGPETGPVTGEDGKDRVLSLEEGRQKALAERKDALDERKEALQRQANQQAVQKEKLAEEARKLEADRERLRQMEAAQMRAPARPARLRGRHVAIVLSFLIMVAAPVAGAGWYLWERAADRYASYAGFSVRTEEVGSAIELLGGGADLSGSSSSDTDILYKFMQSQEIVRAVDARLDLRALWAKGDPEVDPIYAYHPPGTIEDLVAYWERMVSVYNDSGTGLIDLEVQAFTAEDATAVAQAIYDESASLVNRLSQIAQEDATRYAREELETAVERLKNAREAVTRFRNRTQIVDPAASIQSQMGLMASLEAQLAETLIDLDILRQTTAASDPRITQAERRVEVIEARMAEERRKLGIGAEGEEGDTAFADLVGEYERLIVDQEFAEQSYTAALVAFDSAVAESQRQSRYLAAHVRPTLAERAEYPQRITVLALVALFTGLIWSFLVLAGYALKDRR